MNKKLLRDWVGWNKDKAPVLFAGGTDSILSRSTDYSNCIATGHRLFSEEFPD
jgi:hypothetical protein